MSQMLATLTQRLQAETPPHEVIRLSGIDQADLLNQKLGYIIELARRSARLPGIRNLALRIVQGTPERNKLLEAVALYDWVRSNIQYRNDPLVSDSFTQADHTLELGAGDCDDHSILLAALALTVGIEPRFVVVSSRTDRNPNHIYIQLRVGDRWYTADTTNPNGRFGVALPQGIVTRRWIYKVRL